MSEFFRSVPSPDPWALIPLVVISYLLAHYVIRNDRRWQELGMRLAAVGFFIYCVYDMWAFGSPNANEWLGLAVRGFVVAGFVLVGSWILLPTFAAIGRHVFSGPLMKLKSPWAALARHRTERRHQRQFSESAPDRARAREAAEVREHRESVDKRRRDDARVSCEILYRMCRPEIGDRFPPDEYEAFVDEYLGDDHSADYVEQRAAQLQQLIQQHLSKADPQTGLKSLQDLDEWFRGQKAQIDALPDGSLKGSLYALLEIRRSELSLRLFEELSP